MLSTLNLSIAHNLDALGVKIEHLRDNQAAGDILAAELAAALAGAKGTDQVIAEVTACLGRYRDASRKARRRLYSRCKSIDAKHDKLIAADQVCH
ncbi:hypothetical protein JET76_22935 [Pseudomonas putida]|uniref:hypothetical protein n=1 Tax=Pseudomonas TaxID=286 RepID=UPI0018E6CBDE|nr:hypothetical protein [Pseudomonas putida]MBI6944184.1 hypothetical protein [Pseudomonas putida]MBI6960350.1 hypothetical protein [Pseudomonas putida]